ncbi:MAG: ribonuclease M5 [Sporolactobacillus sp.]
MIVREVIVVEGKSDTEAVKRALKAETIETNGSRVSKKTLAVIRHASNKRGVIIFTDPDYPGERIRKIVSAAVPGCKHAFITRREGQGDANESLGIEHASPETIRKALACVYTEIDEPAERISMAMLRHYGLTGEKDSAQLRRRLGDALNIGYSNGKQLYKRLRLFQIEPAEVEQVLEHIRNKEEEH